MPENDHLNGSQDGGRNRVSLDSENGIFAVFLTLGSVEGGEGPQAFGFCRDNHILQGGDRKLGLTDQCAFTPSGKGGHATTRCLEAVLEDASGICFYEAVLTTVFTRVRGAPRRGF